MSYRDREKLSTRSPLDVSAPTFFAEEKKTVGDLAKGGLRVLPYGPVITVRTRDQETKAEETTYYFCPQIPLLFKKHRWVKIEFLTSKKKRR